MVGQRAFGKPVDAYATNGRDIAIAIGREIRTLHIAIRFQAPSTAGRRTRRLPCLGKKRPGESLPVTSPEPSLTGARVQQRHPGLSHWVLNQHASYPSPIGSQLEQQTDAFSSRPWMEQGLQPS